MRQFFIWDDIRIRRDAGLTRPCDRCREPLRFTPADILEIEMRMDDEHYDLMCMACAA